MIPFVLVKGLKSSLYTREAENLVAVLETFEDDVISFIFMLTLTSLSSDINVWYQGHFYIYVYKYMSTLSELNNNVAQQYMTETNNPSFSINRGNNSGSKMETEPCRTLHDCGIPGDLFLRFSMGVQIPPVTLSILQLKCQLTD